MKRLFIIVIILCAMATEAFASFGLYPFIGLRDFSSEGNYGNKYHFTPYTGVTASFPQIICFNPELTLGFTQGKFGGMRVWDFDGHITLRYSKIKLGPVMPLVRYGLSVFFTQYRRPGGEKWNEQYFMFLAGGGFIIPISGDFLHFRFDFNASTNFWYDTIFHTNISLGFNL